MGREHAPQHDCHGLQTCKYHKINRETLGSGSYTPPSARAASPIACQHHSPVHKSNSRQQCSLVFSVQHRHLSAQWLSQAAWREVQSQEGPPPHPSTDPTSLQLITFCWEQEALASTETSSVRGVSCKLQEAVPWMQNQALRPNLAMEETCQVVQHSAGRTLQLSIH